LSVALRTDGQDLSFDTLPQEEDIATVTIVGNLLTIGNFGNQFTYELLTVSEAEAELNSGDLGVLQPSNGIPFDIYANPPGDPLALAAMPNPADLVLRF